MVRRGRLSKGCQTCRQRKIKCDQSRPSCTQCRRAGWRCPQYGDAVDRLFQNQTTFDFTEIQDPGEVKSCKQHQASETYQPGGRAISSQPTLARGRTLSASRCALFQQVPSTRPSPALVPSVKDRALCLFLSNHVLPDSSVPRGCFEYLSAFCIDHRINEQLSSSITSVALAAYANTVQSSAILNDAHQHLVTAIRLVKSALSSHQEAIQDNTVISIMLLSTFETITCRNQRSLVNCDLHMNGATTIINLRGYQQFQSMIGLQLFLQMCSNILLGCLQRSVRVPTDILRLRTCAETFLDTDEPAWRLSEIVVRLSEFRARVKEKSLFEPRRIINAALEIDSELLAWSLRMPEPWQFSTVWVQTEPKLVYEGWYHVYSDVWVAHIWNSHRTCRLLLHQEILTQLRTALSPLSPRLISHEMQYQRSKKALQNMASEICATIPQYTGHLSLLSSTSNRSQTAFGAQARYAAMSTRTIPIAAGIYFLLWPLLNAGEATDSNSQRLWIIGRLRYIGSNTGIQQALALAHTLEHKEKVVVWE